MLKRHRQKLMYLRQSLAAERSMSVKNICDMIAHFYPRLTYAHLIYYDIFMKHLFLLKKHICMTLYNPLFLQDNFWFEYEQIVYV
jgi:hypothetical protein